MFDKLKSALTPTKYEPWIMTTVDGVKHDIGSTHIDNKTGKIVYVAKPKIVFDLYNNSETKDINFWYPYLTLAVNSCILFGEDKLIPRKVWDDVSFWMRAALAIEIGIAEHGKTEPQTVDPDLFNPKKYLLEAQRRPDYTVVWRLRSTTHKDSFTEKLFGSGDFLAA